MIYHLMAITLAYLIDLLIGDPPNWPHPVKWIGNGILKLEKRLNQGEYRKFKGVLMLLLILMSVFLAASLLVYCAYNIHPILGIIVEGGMIASTIAQKSLKQAALEVYDPLKGKDMDQARLKLSYIVGRDTEQLDEGELVRGTVETVSENTSDGVTAPLFWGLIGGAPLAFVYRAINTCDSMVGYKNDRFQEFGWASARLDDVANWIPSRLTGFLMIIGNKSIVINKRSAFSIMLRDAKKHPSPNSGWCEAAVAALLGIQLGGINYYKGIVSNRAKMGDPLIKLQKNHILQANKVLSRTSLLFLLMLWIGGMSFEMAISWFESTVFI